MQLWMYIRLHKDSNEISYKYLLYGTKKQIYCKVVPQKELQKIMPNLKFNFKLGRNQHKKIDIMLK